MKTLIKMFLSIVFSVILLLVGFAAGFPVGQSSGFSAGCEWAIMQANILAREAGLYMPVSFNDGDFCVILKQPPHLYQRAWQLADKYDEETSSIEVGETYAAVVSDLKEQ